MPVQVQSMPFASCYDPSADAAGSADPLGTLGGSERLAEVILPGLTARMWRARLLTFSVVVADIADTVVRRGGDQEDRRLAARLAFERLFVSALVRCEESDPDRYGGVSRRVPGSRTARRALHAGDEPLTRRSFIRGQAVNGPSGVMARLARDLGLLDEAGRVAGRGHDLRAAWGRGESGEEGEASELYRRSAERVEDRPEGGGWPRPGNKLWEQLADALRPDSISAPERNLLTSLLHSSPPHGIRPRVLQLLREERCLAAYQAAVGVADTRGEIERSVLLDALLPLLGGDPVDAHIATAVRAIDAYERFSGVFTGAFESLLWALRASGGSASPEKAMQAAPTAQFLSRCQKASASLVPQLRQVLLEVSRRGPFEEQSVPNTISAAITDAERAAVSPEDVLEAALTRHERVQREKRKPAWVDRSLTWTLMPGTPIVTDPPAKLPTAFLHPYRLVNAYSLLLELRLIKGGRLNGEDDGE